MKFIKALALCAMLWLPAGLPASAADGVTVTHHEVLRDLRFSYGRQGGTQASRNAAPVTLAFDAFGRQFNLELEPNTRLLSRAVRHKLRDRVAVYRGRVAGVNGSWTRIVVAGGKPRGLVWDGRDLYAIEAPGDSALQAGATVMYRLADAVVAPGAMACGTEALPVNAAKMYQQMVGELQVARASSAAASGVGATSNMDIGAVGDFEFFQAKGSMQAANDAIMTRLNNVDGIFSEQVGVQLTVQELEVFDNSGDPFSNTSDAETLLDEVGSYRQSTPAQRQQGLTHLYTGRNLDSSTVGIAYSGQLCRQFFSVGLSEGRGSAFFDSLIAAHEIGHNFGAPHDAEAGSACESTPPDFLMAAELNSSDQFSQCSLDEMQPVMAGAACIVPLPTVDMAISVNSATTRALLGTTNSLTFDVDNFGTEAATSVVVDITIPANVTLLPNGATSSRGSCSSAAGSVDCQFGTVPGGASDTVTLTFTTIQEGNGQFVATVSADDDDNPGNNQETVTLTVEDTVDLVVEAIVAVQADLNEGVAIAANLENQSLRDATAIELSVTVDTGLRVDSADWSLGDCTISGQQVDCTANLFAGQTGAPLQLALTGTAAGSHDFTVSITSAEDDFDDADNSADGRVTVIIPTDPGNNPGGGGGGGGGATGPAPLALLALTLIFANSRRLRPDGRRFTA